MYRCTDCNTEYDYLPDYCDCGNNTFEQIGDNIQKEYQETELIQKRKLSVEEIEELRQDEIEKKKSIFAMLAIFLLCIGILAFPVSNKKRTYIKEENVEKQVKLPAVSSYWNDTVPSKYKSKDPFSNLPLLNSKFKTISPILRKYLVDIGKEFENKWDRSIIDGSGECKVQFTIDKEGNVSSKRIVATSHNDSIDNSVLLVLSKINNFQIPPDDYKGERIYISFKVNENGDSQVVYPMK